MENYYDYEVGDLIKDKHNHNYHIIIDIIDYTDEEGLEHMDVEYECVTIYPMEYDENMFTQDEIYLINKYDTDEFHDSMERIQSLRDSRRYSEVYIDGEIFIDEINISEDIHKSRSKIDIPKIMNDTESDDMMKEYLSRMNIHLDLLNVAIEKNDANEIKFNKDKLEHIRQTLMELEYFPFERKRRR